MTNFDYVSVPKPKESGFDLSYGNKFTMDFGDMVPCYKAEVLPGDEFKAKAQFMVRFAPLSNPIYTKINAQIHYFFVPNRLLWNESKKNSWEAFITGGADGTLNPTPPYMNLRDLWRVTMSSTPDPTDYKCAQSLADYLGVPLNRISDLNNNYQYYGFSERINMLPFLAYQKIYDDWFRDPNVTNSLFDEYEDKWLVGGDIAEGTSSAPYSPSTSNLLQLRKRSWRKDYFTSALPWAQRGEEVHLPVNSTFQFSDSIGGNAENDGSLVVEGYNSQGDTAYALNQLSLGTIRDLRNANALQLWLEKNAIGGGRYIEQLLSHFGVYSDDARMQRAEYLGSVKSPVIVSEVQSNASTEDEPLGKLGGKAISYGNDYAFSQKFKEHGWIIGIMTIMPEASYCQGLHRSLTHRQDKLDYAFPEFAEIGLQQIDTSEIYVTVEDDPYKDTFGYNDRYGEYKSCYNEVHGQFADYDSTLAQFNMTRFFEDVPTLSSDFLEVNESDITSPFVNTEVNSGNIWVDLWNDVKAIRPLPKNSLPLF